MQSSGRPVEISAAEYRLLAAFRRALREFLHFSAAAAKSCGIPPKQHQAILAIKGGSGPDETMLVGDLAKQLGIRHHSAVELVDRLTERGLVYRRPSSADRRKVEIGVTAKGEVLLRRLSAVHLSEIRSLAPRLRQLLADAEK